MLNFTLGKAAAMRALLATCAILAASEQPVAAAGGVSVLPTPASLVTSGPMRPVPAEITVAVTVAGGEATVPDRATTELIAGRDIRITYYCYLNFPTEPWRGYGPERTLGFGDAYTRNPADSVVAAGTDALGITAALWTDYGLTEELLDRRLFPRIFAVAELMWHTGMRKPSGELLAEADAATEYFHTRESQPEKLRGCLIRNVNDRAASRRTDFRLR